MFIEFWGQEKFLNPSHSDPFVGKNAATPDPQFFVQGLQLRAYLGLR
jgi:hypothetical protein